MNDKRNTLHVCLRENEYIVPSYSLYGGKTGFQDYGVMGTKMKHKLLALWRHHFLWLDDILELDTPAIMPYELLKASGHVDRFTDYVVYDENNQCHRADHLVKEYYLTHNMDANSVDSMTRQDLQTAINTYSMLKSMNSTTSDSMNSTTSNSMNSTTSNSMNSTTSNSMNSTTSDLMDSTTSDSINSTTSDSMNSTTSDLMDSTTSDSMNSTTSDSMNSTTSDTVNVNSPITVTTKNLMFTLADDEFKANKANKDTTKIQFLRPELAQGMFVNFKSVVERFNKSLPFGLCQVGKAYRNEINTKPFTRMREFTQAEIEYFVDPEDMTHPLYDDIKSVEVKLLLASQQMNSVYTPINITIADAVEQNYVKNQTMAYFLAKIYQLAKLIGLHMDKVRLRQHLTNEMAHYATECWDLEVLVDGDWLECAGCSHRGNYDLSAHSHMGNLTVRRKLTEPKIKPVHTLVMDKKRMVKTFASSVQRVFTYFNNLSSNELALMDSILLTDEVYVDELHIPNDMIKIVSSNKTVDYEEYIPHVIEPSFGIDRLMYAICEHNFWVRPQDNKRLVLSLPNELTPYGIAIFPLHNKPSLKQLANDIRIMLLQHKVDCYVDTSSVSIGKRYARADERGVKYCITVDPASLDDLTVTIRNRDTMHQIRLSIDSLAEQITLLL